MYHHPFLRCYSEVNPVGFRNLCHTATETISILQGDVVFRDMETTPDPKAFLIVSGMLSYSKGGLQDSEASELNKKEVSHKNWISEANLWTSDWMHCGTLRATTDCTLLAVDAKEFQHTLGPYS